MQAYTLRTAAVAALMLAPAIAHTQSATAARRAAAAWDPRSRRRLSMADVRRYGATMQQIATRPDGVAEYRRAFASTGITPRRFALTQLTFLGAGMALGVPTGGQASEPQAAQMGIDPTDVAFER